MKYTNKEDKEQIKTQFNILLAEKKMSLKTFCSTKNYSYTMVYGRLTRNSISHLDINAMIHQLDRQRSLQRINGKLVISKTF